MEWSRDQLARAPLYVRGNASTVERFAAQELTSYLQRLTGRPLQPPGAISAAVPTLLLGDPLPNFDPSPPPTRGFSVEVAENTIRIRAATPRALLHAVYRLLESLGCRWCLRARAEEFVPTAFRSAPLSTWRWDQDTPEFGFCSDLVSWHYTQPELLHERVTEDREFLDWTAKNGGSFFFFIRHPFDSESTIADLASECERRGIALEHGGHILPLLLPREQFSKHPEWFPMAPDGERTSSGNLCVSHPGALKTVARNAVEFVQRLPNTRSLHLWGADLWKGGWCHCPACQHLGAADQSLRTCNHVAHALAEAGSALPVYYLAYHDTLDPPLREQPAPNVWCEFAPRERCYRHAIGDPQCKRNQPYWTALQRYVERFEGRVRVFEYYGDAILFFGCAVPLTRTIHRDIEQYRSLGISKFSMLQFGSFSRWAYAANFLVFARALNDRWGANTFAGLLHPGCEWLEHLLEIESRIAPLVRYGDIRIPPRDAEEAADLAEQIARVSPELTELATRLESEADEATSALVRLLRYTQAVFAGVEHEIRTGTRASKMFKAALEIMQGVDRRWKGVWGEVDLPVIHDLYEFAPFFVQPD